MKSSCSEIKRLKRRDEGRWGRGNEPQYNRVSATNPFTHLPSSHLVSPLMKAHVDGNSWLRVEGLRDQISRELAVAGKNFHNALDGPSTRKSDYKEYCDSIPYQSLPIEPL